MNTWIELAGQPLVHRLGWVLLHFLWQGTVIAAVWTILRSLLRAHEARTRYAVGCLLFGLMAVSPLITFLAVRVPAEASPTFVDHITGSGSALPATVTASQVYPSMAIPAVAEYLAAQLERWLPSLVTVWCLGVCLLSIRLIRGYWAVRTVRSQHIRPMDQVWLERLAELQRRLRMSRPVLLFESALIQVPVVIGWLRPMILVPASSLSGLTPQQLELILAHELAHIRRHDHWVNLLQVLIETLLFYHPAVWWISRDIRAERELCCDDLAVATCGNRLAYARALTTLETLRQQPAAMALGAGGGSLIERVRHIVGLSGSPGADWRRPVGSALLGVGMLMFAGGVGCLALSPRQYAAVCRVHVERGEPTNPLGVAHEQASFDPYFITTEFEGIQSKVVLYRVIEELGLNERWGRSNNAPLTIAQAYVILKRRMDLRQHRNTGLIEIRVYSDAMERPADEAAEIANKIAEVYRDVRAEGRTASSQRGIKLLGEELARQDEAVRAAQERVDQIKMEDGISDMSEDSPKGLDLEAVRRLLSAHPDDDLSKLLQDLWATEASLASERISKGTDHPDCFALMARISQIETRVVERIEGIVRGLDVRVAAYKAQLESIDKAVEEAKEREAEMTTRYRPYFAAKRDLENQQRIRDSILLRKLQETVNLRIPRRASFDIVDRAEPSMRPVRTGSKLGLALCVAGLATGLSGLLLRGRF